MNNWLTDDKTFLLLVTETLFLKMTECNWNSFMKILLEKKNLDFESTFESASEETAEGSDDRTEHRHCQRMKKEWNNCNRIFPAHLLDKSSIIKKSI